MADADDSPSDAVGPVMPDAPDSAGRWRWYRSALASKQATHGIYIEIVLLALILALETKRPSDASVVTTIFGAIVALTLAELYAYYVGTMIGTGSPPARRELRAAITGTAWSLAATIPPLMVLLLGVVGAFSLSTGFLAAKIAGTAVISVYALLASRRAGLSPARSLLTAALFLGIAAALVFLKHRYH